MSLIYQSFTVILDTNDSGQNTVPARAMSVSLRAGGFADIFDDELGLFQITQPGAVTDFSGIFEFYIEAGEYTLSDGVRTQDFAVDSVHEIKLPLNVKDFGAIEGSTIATDSTAAFASLAAKCLLTGRPWRADGTFYVESIDMYTTGSGDLTLHSINNDQANGVVNILPDPADLGTGDFAAFNALLPLDKGTSKIPSLGIHEGKFCRIASPDRYLNRQGSGSEYRYELQFIVLDGFGNIFPALPYNVPNTVNFTVFDTEILREVVKTPNLTTVLDRTGPSNLYTFSNDFTNAIWFKNQSTIAADGDTPPAGISQTYKVIPNASNVQHDVRQTFTTLSNTPYTNSIFAKHAGDAIGMGIRVWGVSNTVSEFVSIDLIDGSTIISSLDTGSFVTVTNAGSGWFRISVHSTEKEGIAEQFRFQPILDNGNITFAGDGTSGVLIAGSQLEPSFSLNVYSDTTTTPLVLGGRDSQVESKRSKTEITFSSVNVTGAKVLQGFRGNGYKTVNINSDVSRGLIGNIEYGYNYQGCGHELISCSERYCRRGIDATYAYSVFVRGGSYPDGIGAHLGFDFDIDGVKDIGYSTENVNSLHFTGGNLKVANSKVRVLDGAIFEARTDAPEFTGTVLFDTCELIFDWTDKTGSPTGDLYSFALPAIGFDGGRDFHAPDKVSFTNNTVRVLGTGHTGNIKVFNMFDSGSTANDLLMELTCLAENNKYIFDNGSADLRIVANKSDYLTSGSLSIEYKDSAALDNVFLGNGVNTLTAPFIKFSAPNCESAAISADYGWLLDSVARNAIYTSATGTPVYQTDSFWGTASKSGIVSAEHVITDDAVVLIDVPSLYFTVEIFQLNNVSRFAKFNADSDGLGELSSMYSSSIDNSAPTVLTGTTGTDGNVSVSNNGAFIYIENRSGATITVSVIMNSSSV